MAQATNPMLLSLIVLVHFLKVELPEDRQFLYRDCVEILTEQWQKSKAEEAGIRQEEREELTLSQKIVLLREIAFAMQQQREEEGQPTLISRNAARDIIAERLPDFLNTEVPLSEGKRKEFFLRKAEEWIDGIQVDSGILVEQGFGQEGEPLIGFSHLTFQEYLAAVAANDIDEHRSILRHNLLKPAWREVVLLYVALVNDATSTIHALLDAPTQPYGVLLAGACLTERLKKVHPDAQHMVLAKLKQGFSQADDTQVGEFGKAMGQLGQSETTAFLRTQLHHPSLAKRLAVIKALGQTRTNDPEIESVKNDLLQLLDTVSEPEITVATRESLASVGDPRFSNIEPMLVRVHRPYPIVAASPKTWKELFASPEWQKDKKFTRRFELAYCFVTRPMDIWLFLTWNALWRRPQCADFEIGKYPITNLEYNRFIEATGHKAPKQWLEGTFPQEEATHPVRGISSTDAEAYCKWLSNQTGKKYRLPTEWEWEWAAAGPQGWKYPWGNQFDKNKCNTKEAGIENTTPVGSYPAGMSPYGASDMCGNVYEITKGYFLFGDTSNSPFLIGSTLFFVISIFTILTPIFFITLIILNIIFSSYMFFSLLKSVEYSVLRGGVYSAPYDQSTCFYQKYHFRGTISTRGFRCVREL
ncbi:MAG TPA: SUMF1/EgtB/PvdO family nonheme iron enzyme [Ktedonobacteraceae bacterium]|nr:SUMF1/EgtB/PvdO family nonheme iron enzyme [Ktedonobacteraceae bacterium]